MAARRPGESKRSAAAPGRWAAIRARTYQQMDLGSGSDRVRRWSGLLVTLLLSGAILAALVWAYLDTAVTLTVMVEGWPGHEASARIRSHRATVGQVLDDLGVELLPEDRLHPSRETPLQQGLTITIERATPVIIEDTTAVAQANGLAMALRTQADTVAGVLVEAGLSLSDRDEVTLNGQAALPETSLWSGRGDDQGLAGRWRSHLPLVPPWQDKSESSLDPPRISVRRAVPFALFEVQSGLAAGASSSDAVGEGGRGTRESGPSPYVNRRGPTLPVTIWTTASTVGEALMQEGLLFYEGDLVRPGLGTPMMAGLQVTVERSLPVTLQTGDSVGDRALHTRTRQQTVSDLLAEQGLLLAGLDRIEPALDTPLSPDLVVRITRVEHRFDIEEDIKPYVAVWEPDGEMEIDTRRLDNEGVNGITRRRYRVVLVHGVPFTRTLEDTWVAQRPITRVLKYGTNIVLRDLETPEGTLTYWRKMRVFATSYSASEAGVPVDAPYFGRTRLGTPVRYGVVAVDPSVITMRSQMYVPGYGVASAEDTGGAIQGRWIDLAYEDGQLVRWSRCVDVYLLAPPPASYQIDYMLPNHPSVPCLRR